MARSFTILSAAVFLVLAGSVAHAATDPADACKNTKAKAAGKKAADLMKALGKNCKKPDTAKLTKSISKAQSKLTKQFVKAEGKGGCLTTGDVSAIEAKVDALAFDIAGDVNPPDTTTTTTVGATTTTTASATTTTTAGATTTTTAGATTTTTAGATTTTTAAPTTTTTTTTTTTMPPPPPTCSPASPYPACDGTCPPGSVCTDAAFPGPPVGFCDCTPVATLCGDPPGGAPACYGDCPMPGDVCKFDGVSLCTCEPEFPPCGPGTLWPICDGVCPPGTVCADTLATGFCSCEPPISFCGVFPDGPPECWGDCPPGEVCIFDGAAMCECIPVTSPSGAFLSFEGGLLD